MRKFPWIRLTILTVGAVLLAYLGLTRHMPTPTPLEFRWMGVGVAMFVFGIFSLHYWPTGTGWQEFFHEVIQEEEHV